MSTTVALIDDIEQVWRAYKADMTNKELRNRLVVRYLRLV